MADPQTSLHYAPNGNFDSNGNYLPGVDGFNLADVSSVGAVNALPAGVKGLVWLGDTGGVTQSFINQVTPLIGNSKVYGFYVADEPDPSSVSAANLKAESDWIHQHDPGVKTFIVEYNSSSDTSPSFAFNPANTDIDVFGLDPYPVRPPSEGSEYASGADYNTINLAVAAAENAGIPQADIVPVYQAFGGGGYSSWTLPTASQEQQILSTWGSLVPTPAFDYAYSWGTQDGDTALSTSSALQAVFAAHNSGGSNPPPPNNPTISNTITMTATDSSGHTQAVPVVASGSLAFSGTLAGTITQQATAGIDTISASSGITGESMTFTTGNAQISFQGSQARTVTGGSGTDIVTASAGRNRFTAGTGTLDVTGGSGRDAYTFHAGDGLLKIEDFSASKGDTLTVDSSLRSSLRTGSDGHGGTLLSFGTSGSAIDIVNRPNFSVSTIHFQ
jgi:hypothetical protein